MTRSRRLGTLAPAGATDVRVPLYALVTRGGTAFLPSPRHGDGVDYHEAPCDCGARRNMVIKLVGLGRDDFGAFCEEPGCRVSYPLQYVGELGLLR